MPRVQLVGDGIKIQARLLGGSSCRQGIILRTEKFEMRVVHADFHQNGLQQLTISFREALAKDARRHADDELAVFRAFLPRGTKPSREAVGVNPPLHMLQNFVPRIHCFGALFKAKIPPDGISTDVEKLWK